EDESSRRCITPPVEGVLGGQSVEGVVDLDHGEAGRVMVQPLTLRDPLRVERSLPVPVLPPTRTDPDHRTSFFEPDVDLMGRKVAMGLLLLLIIVLLLAAAGVLGFVLKVAAGVALGLFIGVALV